MSSSTVATDGENQRTFKMERMQCSPSRVLHLCQVPDSVTDTEVISLGLPFGEVTNVLLLKRKKQAFLEMASEEAAANMMKHYTSVRPVLRSQPIYIQFSNYKKLQTDHLPRSHDTLRAVKSGRLAVVGAVAAEGGLNPRRSAVLRVIVDNAYYPITLEILHQVFSKFGPILRIIIFSKNSKFQFLLEYANPVNACCAKRALNGQNMFNTCCMLRIEFSRLPSLKIKYNNEKSRDFTRFDLPPGDVQPYMEPPVAPAYGPQNAILPPYAGAAGFIQPIGFTQGPGLPVPVVPGVISSVPVTAAAVPALRPVQNVTAIPESSVLLVRNFNSEAIKIHGLFILFGVYGNVLRVKIMKKGETAFVQMMDAVQAHLAVIHLNGQRIYGQVLQVSLSEYQTIQYPQWGQEDQELLEDYCNSPLHRFRKPGSKNYQNISAPSDTLHLCSIPSSATADELKKLFAGRGSTVKGFRFLKSQSVYKMALIQMGSVEEAIQALIELHNHDFGENQHLRISFSKMRI